MSRRDRVYSVIASEGFFSNVGSGAGTFRQGPFSCVHGKKQNILRFAQTRGEPVPRLHATIYLALPIAPTTQTRRKQPWLLRKVAEIGNGWR